MFYHLTFFERRSFRKNPEKFISLFSFSDQRIMALIRRKIAPFEKNFIFSDERVQFAVCVDNKNVIPTIIKNIKNSFLGFSLKIEGDEIVHHSNPIQIDSLPNHIHTAKDAAEHIAKMPADYSQSLAQLAINDSTVAISVSHVVCDGGLIVKLFPHLLNENLVIKHNDEIKIPIPVEYRFAEEVSKRTQADFDNHNHGLQKLSRIYWERNDTLPKDILSNYYITETPVDQLQCFKKENKGFNLTDSLWTAMVVTDMALNNQIETCAGVNTCIDLRNPKETEIDPLTANNFTAVNVFAENINEKTTIREIGRKMREDFIQKRKRGDHFACLGAMMQGFFFPGPYGFSMLSNIGKFVVKPPVTDVMIQQTIPAKCVEGLAAVLSFSKQIGDKNIVVTRVQQSPFVMSDEKAQKQLKYLNYVMENVPIDVELAKALDIIKKL
ncbi:hypothetical protein TRFO_19336 [Tritrichomonas foetus]|uniref:Condensation domain-containing protein n=1 Tax=Tritrichomonas foetus TaxID=1144522 RepID=A0A1J4KJ51_9EUKA|nr:hypothetical protein TRFO_19336 [Tritrichomonas foetus]|eukprot:OHT11251.1 hypothetical protein TRFO_19336 [Tritrichomonas foetus]